MPLNTQILRNGKTLKVRWGGFHVVAMTLAAAYDSGRGPFVGKQAPVFHPYKEGDGIPEEWVGKGPEAYPEVPCPISPSNVWELMGYHIIGTTPLNDGSYTLKGEHKFVDTTDGEVFHLLPGDELVAYRN